MQWPKEKRQIMIQCTKSGPLRFSRFSGCLLIYDLILLLPLSTQHYTENYGLNSKSDPISGAPRVKNWR
jgi:hypothetical protein